MKIILLAALLFGACVAGPLMAQEKRDIPMKEGMPMNGEGMKGGGMVMGKMISDMSGMMKQDVGADGAGN